MAELVNRPSAGRVECLHYLMKNLYSRFGTSETFTLNDAKFSYQRSNVHSVCKLLKKESNLGISYCPYFTNLLSRSGCALTNSLEEDSQKQKAVSNTINALHGLGFVERGDNACILTVAGERFANTDFESQKMTDILSVAILNYGPMIGYLGRIRLLKTESFSTRDIEVGYPSSDDNVTIGDQIVKLSVGSEADSDTRTKSVLTAWAVTGGFISPKSSSEIDGGRYQIKHRNYLLQDVRTVREFVLTSKAQNALASRNVISRPLDYEHLVKDVRALRERGQELIRNATMNAVIKVRNRRFAIIYLLNKAASDNSSLNFEQLTKFLQLYPDEFVINSNDFPKILVKELSIAFCAGIPFEAKGYELIPMNRVSVQELSKGVPDRLIEILNDF